jgi:hypothetical protein
VSVQYTAACQHARLPPLPLQAAELAQQLPFPGEALEGFNMGDPSHQERLAVMHNVCMELARLAARRGGAVPVLAVYGGALKRQCKVRCSTWEEVLARAAQPVVQRPGRQISCPYCLPAAAPATSCTASASRCDWRPLTVLRPPLAPGPCRRCRPA